MSADCEQLLNYFEYKRLPDFAIPVGKMFYELALRIIKDSSKNPERKIAIRKLLEAKDSALRAVFYQT